MNFRKNCIVCNEPINRRWDYVPGHKNKRGKNCVTCKHKCSVIYNRIRNRVKDQLKKKFNQLINESNKSNIKNNVRR